MLGSGALEANLRELPRWAASFHVPDVLWYRDIARTSAVFLERAERQLATQSTDPVEVFPYPKGDGRTREFTLLSATDLVVSRMLVGGIVERTDALLPPGVFSSRLAARPPRWRLQDARKAHRALRDTARSLVEQHGRMLKMDVETYFPTVDLNRLTGNLLAWGCDERVVARLSVLLRGWQASGCGGMPIGGEAFSVLGNAYILPLDARLIAAGVPYVRWMDDIFAFGTHELLAEAVEVADDELARLGLTRSRTKTHGFDVAAALEEIADGMLTSVFSCVRLTRWSRSRRVLRERFLEHVVYADEIVPRRFRGLVKTFTNRRDEFLIHWLAMYPELLNEDPMVTGNYLQVVPPRSPISEIFVDLLIRIPPESRNEFDARDLHLLRGLSSRAWGRSEGDVFWKIALDEDRRGPVRAWAIMAAARSPAWSRDQAIERVLEEVSPYVRRAFLLSLRREVEHPRVRSLLLHVRRHADDLVPMAAWISR